MSVARTSPSFGILQNALLRLLFGEFSWHWHDGQLMQHRLECDAVKRLGCRVSSYLLQTDCYSLP